MADTDIRARPDGPGSRPTDQAPAGLGASRVDPSRYRGWLISFDYPPIPCRDFDWSATHPDYDGADDANDNRVVHGRTRDAVIAEINLWHEENAA